MEMPAGGGTGCKVWKKNISELLNMISADAGIGVLSMKKTTTKVTIIILIVLVAVVGFYAYLQGKIRSESKESVMTDVQKVLYRDMSTDYPATVKEVIKYYVEIQKCFYKDSTTAEELEQLGMRARDLYDADLLANNAEEYYLLNLLADVNDFKNKKRTITNVAVASSVNVDTFEEDGYEFARIGCNYYIREGSNSSIVKIIYLLRRDENRRWKIYGWDNAENVHVE